MSDDLRNPVGLPMDNDADDGVDDDNGADEGEVTEKDYEEVADVDEQLSDDPSYGEDEVEYDPATQAPKGAER